MRRSLRVPHRKNNDFSAMMEGFVCANRPGAAAAPSLGGDRSGRRGGRAGSYFAPCVLLLAAALGLTGCHGSKGSTAAFEVPDEFDTSQQYEITFWAKNDTNKTQVAVYDQAIEDFEALYPNITVTVKYYTDYSKIYNDVITNISTNTTPNVCITYPDHIATYMTGDNVVVPLDDLFADPEYGLGGSELLYDGPTQDEIIPQFLEECEIDGAHYAIPYMRSTEAVYINVDFVEALGYEVPDILTWDWMFEVAEAAMETNEDGTYKINGQNVLIPIIYKSTDNMMIQMLQQQGAGYISEDGEILLFNDTTTEILKTIAEAASSGSFSTFKISSYPANFLNAGQCIFAIDSTAGATWMGTDAPLIDISEDAIVEFETAVRMVPQYDTENPQMISQGPSICIFNKEDTQEVLASWLFAQYLLTNEVQLGYAETEGYVPVTSKAQESEEYQAYLAAEGEDNDDHYAVKIQASKLLLDYVEYSFTTPVFNGSTSVRTAAGQLIELTVKAVRRGELTDMEDSAFYEETYADVTSLYRLDQLGSSSSSEDGEDEGGTETGEDGTTSGSTSEDLGPLPAGSKALLGTLAAAWVVIIAVTVLRKRREKKALQGAS